MCGLVGVVAFDQGYAVDPQTLRRMSDRIRHRGPDGEGTWFSLNTSGPQVALAHRRLAILDPDPRSNQPFTDGSRWLVFNGEIYNFRELRAELSPRGWKTTGDTEVLLAAYDAWGEKCVDHFNGMFAFAVWDEHDKSLFLARDRMGQKPLYLATIQDENQKICAAAFASEIGPLLELNWVDQATNRPALVEYLHWGYVPTPQTIYRGITQIEPAQTLLISGGIVQPRRYFQPDQSSVSQATVRQLVQQAVARQLVSDVPLGCFLSGGIDSSIIAAAMTAAVPREQKVLTFSIGFEDARYDETSYAAKVAAHLGTAHESMTIRPDAAEILPELAAAFGQPFADSSAIPTYYLAQQTRRQVKVALSGDGGDELFGGYDRYRALRVMQSGGQFPAKMLAPFMSALSGLDPKSPIARLKRLTASAGLPLPQRYSAYMRLMDETLIESLLFALDKLPRPDLIERLFASGNQKNPVETALSVDRQTYLPDDLLTKVDRCSMLHALEVRSPFMDHELVSFAAKLNADQLVGGGGKRMLREAFAGDLPDWVFKRKKMGFAVPIGAWLRSSLRPMLHDLLFAADSFAAANFHRSAIETMIREHDGAHADHSQRLYALLMLELWKRTQAF